MSNDNRLVQVLPLPVSQLLRRAANAKAASDALLTSYYAWEASLKLFSSAAIVEYAALEQRDPEIDRVLQALARPSVGQWWHFLRRLLPVLAECDDTGFSTARKTLLGRNRDDLPFAAGLDNALRAAINEPGGARGTVQLTELYDRLVKWRNQEIAHGAAGQRDAIHNEKLGRAMLSGVGDLLAKVDILAGRRLLFVTDVLSISSGEWQIEALELRGESPKRIEPIRVLKSDSHFRVRPERVYLFRAAASSNDAPHPQPAFCCLHPLFFFDAEEEECYFLNGRRGKSKAEYLCYTTGRHHCCDALDKDHRQLLVDMLGVAFDSEQPEAWDKSELAAAEPEVVARHTLGEFELLSKIGQGGMGIVYRAWQPSLGRQVAVKSLIGTGEPAAEKRFAREIQALGRVEHPNVVKIYTSGVDGDNWYFAMELVEGAALSEVRRVLTNTSAAEVQTADWQGAISTACDQARSREKSLSSSSERAVPSHDLSKLPTAPESSPSIAPTTQTRPPIHHVVEVVRQMAEATHALHERGIVHRDIKPGNIMITSDGQRAVLMDLGLAKIQGQSSAALTQSRQFVGTLRYASPEQLVSSQDLDGSTDIYSLGATLWELLTLQPLYGATEDTPPQDLLVAIQQKTPQRIHDFNPNVRADLEAIVFKCLEKDPRKRYATAAELAADLQRWQEGEPVRARKLTPWYFLERKLARNKAKVAGAAAFVLVASLLVALIVWSLSNDDELRARQAIAVQAFAGLDGGWWFQDAPWLIPPVRSAMADAVRKGNLGLGAGEGLATNPDKQQVLRELRAWFNSTVAQLPPNTRERLDKLVFELDKLSEADLSKEQREATFTQLLPLLEKPETAETIHSRAVIHHNLSQHHQGNRQTYDTQIEMANGLFKTALKQYALDKNDAGRALCLLDLAQHLSTRLLDQGGRVHQDRLQEMEACFDEAINWKDAPEVFQVDARVKRGTAIRKTRDFDKADAWFDKAYDSAKTLQLVATSGHPDHPMVPHVHEQWAWSLMDQWRVEEAREHFKVASAIRLEQAERGDASAWPRLLHDRHGLAMALRYCGKLQEAENEYDQIIGTDGESGVIRLRRQAAQAALSRGDQRQSPGQVDRELEGRLRNTMERRADCALYGRSFDPEAARHLERAAHLYGEAKRISTEQGQAVNSSVMGYKRVLALLLNGDAATAATELKQLPTAKVVAHMDSTSWRINNLSRAVHALLKPAGAPRRESLRAFLDKLEDERDVPANVDRDTFELRLLCARLLLDCRDLGPNSKDRASDAFSYIATVIEDINERRGQAGSDAFGTFLSHYNALALEAVCQANPQSAKLHFTDGPDRRWNATQRKSPVIAVLLPEAAGLDALVVIVEPPSAESAHPQVRFFPLEFGRAEIADARGLRLRVPQVLERYLRQREWDNPEDIVWCGEAEDHRLRLTAELDHFTATRVTGYRENHETQD